MIDKKTEKEIKNFLKEIESFLGCSAYVIHNEKTAKYRRGNMREQIVKEFKEKWY